MVITMRELAKLCNVSISTVSKAFLDADDVSSNTKKHIFEIAKENGCYGKFYKGKYHKKIMWRYKTFCYSICKNPRRNS